MFATPKKKRKRGFHIEYSFKANFLEPLLEEEPQPQQQEEQQQQNEELPATFSEWANEGNPIQVRKYRR